MSVNVLERTIEILLIEDNPGDIRLLQEAFKEVKLCNSLSIIRDGESGLAFLKKEAPYQDAPHPDLILLDLNLPRMDGRELLGEIKQCPKLRTIPVVVLTSSKAEKDIIRSYELHANCYITKPVDLDQYIRIVRSIEQFWLSIVELP